MTFANRCAECVPGCRPPAGRRGGRDPNCIARAGGPGRARPLGGPKAEGRTRLTTRAGAENGPLSVSASSPGPPAPRKWSTITSTRTTTRARTSAGGPAGQRPRGITPPRPDRGLQPDRPTARRPARHGNGCKVAAPASARQRHGRVAPKVATAPRARVPPKAAPPPGVHIGEAYKLLQPIERAK